MQSWALLAVLNFYINKKVGHILEIEFAWEWIILIGLVHK